MKASSASCAGFKGKVQLRAQLGLLKESELRKEQEKALVSSPFQKHNVHISSSPHMSEGGSKASLHFKATLV